MHPCDDKKTFKMKIKEPTKNVDDGDKLTIEDVIELGGDQVVYLAISRNLPSRVTVLL